MSDSDRIQLSYAKETTYGTPPTGAYQIMRATSESLHQETSTITSSELRADRQIPDVVRSNLSAAGDISTELSYSFEDFFEASLMSAAWSTGASLISSTSGDIDIDADGGTADGSARVSFANSPALAPITAGMWVKLKGFGTAANNGYFKVTAVDDGLDTIDITPNANFVDETDAPTAATVSYGSQIVNGTTSTSYTIEKKYADLSTNFAIYNGMMIDSMSLNVSTEAMVTGGFTFIGAKGESKTSTYGSSYTAATTKDVMNSVDDVTGVMESDTYVARNITSWSINVANNLRPRLQIGTLGAVSIGSGTCSVSGTLQGYYSDTTLLDKYMNFTDTALAVAFDDTDGNSYIVDCPKVIFTSAQRVAGGQNQDIIADISWEAVMDDTEGITVRLVKFDA